MLVFLCHASDDKPAVRRLAGQLRGDGFDPWLDEERLLPVQDWEFEIAAALKKADVVVVCLSNSSVSKVGYIQREMRRVLDAAEHQPERPHLCHPRAPRRLPRALPPESVAVCRPVWRRRIPTAAGYLASSLFNAAAPAG